jgi:hypothetical protein
LPTNRTIPANRPLLVIVSDLINPKRSISWL